jgi:putative aminopeptidase FrvX
MGLHQTKELLHSKGNSHQTQEIAHRMRENLCQLPIQEVTNIQNLQGTKKTQPPKNQYPKE